MKRREFLRRTMLATGVVAAPALCIASVPTAGRRIRWTRSGERFTAVECDHEPMGRAPDLLSAQCRVVGESAVANPGPLRISVAHRLHDSGAGMGDDLLEATLTVRNAAQKSQRVELEFATSARPSLRPEEQQVYVPLSAAGLFGDGRFAALGVKQFLRDCKQPVGASDFAAHYLEPMASFPGERETRALLLAPVVDVFGGSRPWRVSLFTPSDQPMRFSQSRGQWHVARQVVVAAGETLTQRCWLMLHQGDARVAWKAFQRFGHREDFAVPDWAQEMKVHYYDFLSSAAGQKGRRGGGYESDLPHFRAFRVGMATQHGYYPAIGDFVQPDRKTWTAMRGDKQGAAEMSFDKMLARIQATRAAGAKAAIYIHAALFDDATPCFAPLRESIQVDARGQRMDFGWTGPDTAGKTWRASLGSAEWRAHLLQQVGWIMDILKPDAIVVDETFAGLGYDHHPSRAGATSAGAIDFYRKLRARVRSFGNDRAVFTSDCSMSPFVLWADGEVGDHAYPGLLGHPLYTQEPVRYLAALGDKPWRPCAWHFQQMWGAQMKLTRQAGAGVGVSNGWLEYTGLTRLPADVKSRMLADIATLFT